MTQKRVSSEAIVLSPDSQERELHLHNFMCDYEKKYFADFTLNDKEFYKFLPPGLSGRRLLALKPSLSISYYQVVFRKFNDETEGLHNGPRRMISIGQQFNTERLMRPVLLHEMIHAYEYQFVNRFHHLYQPLLIFLFERMSKSAKYGEMRERIQESLTFGQEKHGHTLFFWLKSLELDEEVGLEAGTIAGAVSLE